MENDRKQFVVMMSVIGFFGLLGLVCGGISIYCFVTYGNLPITEIPAWALLFMFKWGN